MGAAWRIRVCGSVWHACAYLPVWLIGLQADEVSHLAGSYYQPEGCGINISLGLSLEWFNIISDHKWFRCCIPVRLLQLISNTYGFVCVSLMLVAVINVRMISVGCVVWYWTSLFPLSVLVITLVSWVWGLIWFSWGCLHGTPGTGWFTSLFKWLDLHSVLRPSVDIRLILWSEPLRISSKLPSSKSYFPEIMSLDCIHYN